MTARRIVHAAIRTLCALAVSSSVLAGCVGSDTSAPTADVTPTPTPVADVATPTPRPTATPVPQPIPSSRPSGYVSYESFLARVNQRGADLNPLLDAMTGALNAGDARRAEDAIRLVSIWQAGESDWLEKHTTDSCFAELRDGWERTLGSVDTLVVAAKGLLDAPPPDAADLLLDLYNGSLRLVGFGIIYHEPDPLYCP